MAIFELLKYSGLGVQGSQPRFQLSGKMKRNGKLESWLILPEH